MRAKTSFYTLLLFYCSSPAEWGWRKCALCIAIITHVVSATATEIANMPCIFVIVFVFVHLSLYLHSFTAAVQRKCALCIATNTHVVSFTFLWNYESVFVFVYFCVIVQQLKDVYMSLYLCNCLFPYTLFPQQLSGMGLS